MTRTEHHEWLDAAYLWSDKDGRAILDAERRQRERTTKRPRPETAEHDPKARRCA